MRLQYHIIDLQSDNIMLLLGCDFSISCNWLQDHSTMLLIASAQYTTALIASSWYYVMHVFFSWFSSTFAIRIERHFSLFSETPNHLGKKTCEQNNVANDGHH